MLRLLSIFAQPAFGHLTTLKRHSDWCFLRDKLINIKIRETTSTIRLNLIYIFSLSTALYVCMYVCNFILTQVDEAD